jgi:hypothetical protein
MEKETDVEEGFGTCCAMQLKSSVQVLDEF